MHGTDAADAARMLLPRSLAVFASLSLLPLASCSDDGGSTSHTAARLPDGGTAIGVTPSGSDPNGGGTSVGTTGSASQDGGAPREATCTAASKRFGVLGMVECVPSGMEGKTSTPAGLVVAMHGYTQGVEQAHAGGAPWGFKPTSEWAVLAERHRFYVIYPDKGTSAFQWYAFFGTTGIGRNDLEPSAIASMVKDMQARHNIDPDRVFVNGLSAGAYMTTVMLATYPDVFAAGAMVAGGAYGCSTSCAALGKKGQSWTWPGNHSAALVTGAYGSVWGNPNARKPRLMVFQGDADGAVTPENMSDVVQQWSGALGLVGPGTKSTLKGHEYTEWQKGGSVVLATVLMHGIGHGTPVDPGTGPDQGGWDPEPSKTMQSDSSSTQDWTNSAGIYGPYYAAKFFGLVP